MTAKWSRTNGFSAEVVSAAVQQASRASILEAQQRQYFRRAGRTSDGVNAAPTTPVRGLDLVELGDDGVDAIAADLKAKASNSPRADHGAARHAHLLHPRPEGVSIELLDRNV